MTEGRELWKVYTTEKNMDVSDCDQRVENSILGEKFVNVFIFSLDMQMWHLKQG